MSKFKICGHGATNKYILSSPIGELILETCQQGLISLNMKESIISEKDFEPNASTRVAVQESFNQKPSEVVKNAVEWLKTYFDSPKDVKSRPIPAICCLSNLKNESPFTKKVLHSLAVNVDTGKTVSYGELAVLSGGTPKASRAVGQAMKNNPVMIIVPCHRVILSSGALGNYSSGQKNVVKQWLLKHEGMDI